MRTYKRKSTRGTYSRETLEAAAASVVFGGLSIRKSATEYGVNYKTLRRYITKYKNNQFSLQGVPIGYVINPIPSQALGYAEYIRGEQIHPRTLAVNVSFHSASNSILLSFE